MKKEPIFIKDKKLNAKKLLDFGFVKNSENFIFSTDILDDNFKLNVLISTDGKMFIEVNDKQTNEEYALAYVNDLLGAFVGKVKSAVNQVCEEIIENCYDNAVFKTDYAQEIANYILEKFGESAEHLWESTPSNAIFRNSASGKWFAVLILVEKRKIGIDEDGFCEILNLKDRKENVESYIKSKKYLPGYHMNKKHWYTILLDGGIPLTEIFTQIDVSYNLIKKG